MRASRTILLLVSVLLICGCLGSPGEPRPSSDQQALDALNQSQAALANVTAYRAQATGSAEMTDDDRQVSGGMDTDVRVNVSTQEVKSTTRIEDPSFPVDSVRDLYITEYTVYSECRLTGWGQRNLSEEQPWFAYTPIGGEVAVLDRAPVYWRGTDRLDGTETAVIVAHPTEEELQAIPNTWSLDAENPDGARLQNATLTVWLDTETWLPVQIHRETSWRTGGADVSLTTTWRFDAYDEPTVIERPSFDASEIRESGC